MRIQQLEVFKYEELGDSAKAAARAWYRIGDLEYEWYSWVYDDFVKVCGMLGIELTYRPVTLVGGSIRQDPQIYFSGFSSQGDGACFIGRYAYAPGGVAELGAANPEDAKLIDIAETLQRIQRSRGYKLRGEITQCGMYSNDGAMRFESESHPHDERACLEQFRRLARWLYARLESEYDYLTSDERVEERLIDSDHEFYADGGNVRNDKA